MPLKKVRIQLLDENTGAVIEEVDVQTSADAVLFADGQTFQDKLNAGTLRGQQGIQGERGAQGTQGLKGDKGDTGTQGIQGAKGDKGDSGVAGSRMHNVTATPSTALGVISDWAINSVNGDLYEKTATSTWTKRGNIKGAQGERGEQGTQGLKGDKGEQGIQGLKGADGAQGVKGDKGDPGIQGAKGDKGDPGDNIKVGATPATAVERKLFFKVI